LLDARKDDIDARRTEATADGRIIAFGAGQFGHSPLEGLGLLADQQHVIDAKARGLGFGDALNRCWRSGLWALINGALVLLTQGTFTFLLALLFNEGLRRSRELRECERRKHCGYRRHYMNLH